MALTPPPRQDKELSGHVWQEWFRLLREEINNMGNYDLNAIAAGAVPGKTAFRQFGTTSPGVVGNALLDVWPLCNTYPAYIFPVTAARLWIVSSSASDSAAGTGIRTVMIHYLDANNNYAEETLALNGTTAVQTTASMLRINFIHTVTVGSIGTAVGNISLQNLATAPTAVYGYIPLGFNTIQQLVYSVPANKTAYITMGSYSAGTATGTHFTQVYLRSTNDVDGDRYPGIFMTKNQQGCLNGGGAVPFTPPIKLTGPCDIKVSAISDAGSANATVTSFITGWLE